MSASRRQRTRRPFMGAVAVGLFGFGIAYAGPRADKDSSTDTVQAVETRRVVEVQPAIEGPLAVPTALGDKANMLQPLPQGVPIVITEVHMDMRTGGRIAAAGSSSALVFLDGGDSGFFTPIKASDVGTFVAQQVIFGNGWISGDSINGYSMTVFNSSYGPSGPMIVRTSLWDGDPFGTMDTLCAVDGVPAEIPGTAAIFGPLADASGNGEGGLCAPLPLLTGPCVGLWKLTASFDKVVVVCDRAYMVKEALEGCRVGWRLAGNPFSRVHNGPRVGFGDLVELTFDCGQGQDCPTTTGRNSGFCCNTGAACDDSDEVSSCSHQTFCTSGVADTQSAFAFGGGSPGYHATHVSDVRAATDVSIFILPVAGGGGTINGNEIVLARGDVGVTLELRLSDWDPGQVGLAVKAYLTGLDTDGFTSSLRGTLTPWEPYCTSNDDCSNAFYGTAAKDFGPALHCRDSLTCTPAWINHDHPENIFADTTVGLSGSCNSNELRCGRTASGSVNSPGHDVYLMSAAVYVPPNAAGTFTILPARSSLRLGDATHLPLLGLTPALITIETGACCDFTNPSLQCLGDTLTWDECAAAGGAFHPGRTCNDKCDSCPTDRVCGDGDACTVDICDTFCQHQAVAVEPNACCNSATTLGSFEDIHGVGIEDFDDGNACTIDLGICSEGGDRGLPLHDPEPTSTLCDDGVRCTTDDRCDGKGQCVGTVIKGCGEDALPTVSGWALVVIGLTLLVVAKVKFTRRFA